MARKPDIEYVNNFYVYGSEAKIIQFKPSAEAPRTTLPKPIQEKKLSVLVDPVALFGLAVAAVMLVVMLVGLVDYHSCWQENQAMQEYTAQLRNDNIMYKHNYRNSYDLDTVRETALALGMVEASQVTTVALEPAAQEQDTAPQWWQDLTWKLSLLFANA